MGVVEDHREITRRLALLSMEPEPDAPAWWGHGTKLQWSLVLGPPDPEWGEMPRGAVLVTAHCALMPEFWRPARRTRHRYVWCPTDAVELPAVAMRSVCFSLDAWYGQWRRMLSESPLP